MIELATALWLGILTSFSPCPLATNLAAVGWLAGSGPGGRSPAGGRVSGRGSEVSGSEVSGSEVRMVGRTLRAGLLYGLGRAVSYALLGAALTASVLTTVDTARFLQVDLNRVLGPVMILVGMVLLDLLPLRVPGFDLEQHGRRAVVAAGGAGAFALGALFALSFCPVSAALFFGSLLPLAVADSSPWLLPAVYGVGTSLPVLGLAAVLAFGAERLGSVVRRAETVERGLRRATGVLFVGAGLYLAWTYVIGPRLAG